MSSHTYRNDLQHSISDPEAAFPLDSQFGLLRGPGKQHNCPLMSPRLLPFAHRLLNDG
jgi:hypothetical protein